MDICAGDGHFTVHSSTGTPRYAHGLQDKQANHQMSFTHEGDRIFNAPSCQLDQASEFQHTPIVTNA